MIECMDGRPQRKVADYLMLSFGVRHVDTITTAGAVKHLAEDTDHTPILLSNLEVSLSKHGSTQIAVVAHHDCAGNPVSPKVQKNQLVDAARKVANIHPEANVVALWLDEHFIMDRIRWA